MSVFCLHLKQQRAVLVRFLSLLSISLTWLQQHQTCAVAFCMWQACFRCHPECRTCDGQGLSFCTSCVHYEQDHRCISKCSSDYYVDAQHGTSTNGIGRCKRCDSRCLTCTGPTASDCITCVGYKLYYDLADGSEDSRVCCFILYVKIVLVFFILIAVYAKLFVQPQL